MSKKILVVDDDIELCNLLKISVNELLTGEHIAMENYKEAAETEAQKVIQREGDRAVKKFQKTLKPIQNHISNKAYREAGEKVIRENAEKLSLESAEKVIKEAGEKQLANASEAQIKDAAEKAIR